MSESNRIWGTLDPFYEPGPVLGRKVANIGFLRALLAADRFDEYHFFLGDQGVADSLRSHITKIAPNLLDSGRLKTFDRRELPAQVAKTSYHCFHLSDCITTQPHLTRLRNRYSRTIFPITGTIHSLSYAEFSGPFLRHLWAGTTERDAIVCTSAPGRQAVEHFFGWLRSSYDMTEAVVPAPQLPLIPLGVDVADLKPGGQQSDDGPVRLLVFGRISHHSKMDLLPLVRALHRLVAEGLDPKSVELVLAGWADDNDDFLPTLKDYVNNVGIPLSVSLRPTEAEKHRLYQSSDIFISIADNPQETFGITVAEAGAFGLPSVVSEYDGYRDIIRHGETGLLVPTIGPDETSDADILAPLTYGNQYHLLLAQRTAVEIPALAEALHRLITSPDERRSMGEAARKRVAEQYSWEQVIRQYHDLWDELYERPVDPDALRDVAHPQTMPYADLFGHYTTKQLDPEMRLKAGRTGEAFYRGQDYPTLYSGMTLTIDPELAKKLVFLARKSVDSDSLIRKLIAIAPEVDETTVKNHIMWSLKHDILERVP